MNSRPKPVTEIRLGAIKAAVWKNESETGPRYSATFSRLYRDGEQWQHTDSFYRDDLLVLAKVADQAHSWIFSQARDPGSTATVPIDSPTPNPRPPATPASTARTR